jgi:hypothetical protein
LGNVWKALQPVIERMVNMTITVVELSAKISKFITGAIADFIGFLGDVRRTFDDVKDAITKPIGTATKFVTDKLDDVVDFVKGLPGKVKRAANGLFDSIGDEMEKPYKYVRDKIDDIVGLAKSLPGKISGAVKGAFNGIVSGFKDAYNTVARFINNIRFPGINMPSPIPDVPGFDLPNVPVMHQGGIVGGQPGADVLIMAQQGERITPRGASADGGNVYHLTVHALDSKSAATAVIDAIDEWERRNGRRFGRAA